MNQLLKEQIEDLSRNKETILEALDIVKNHIADARNGDYSVEARKVAIEAIDNVLYNKIKNFRKETEKKSETYL